MSADLADQAMQWLQRRERKRDERAAGGPRRAPVAEAEPEEEEWELEDEEAMENEDEESLGGGRAGGPTSRLLVGKAAPSKPAVNSGAIVPVGRPGVIAQTSAPKGYAAARQMAHLQPQRPRVSVPPPRSVPTSYRDPVPKSAPTVRGVPQRVQPVNRAPPPVARAPPVVSAPAESFPKDKPVLIQLPDDVPEFLEGMNETAIAFSYEGKKRALLTETDEVLKDFLGGTDEKAGVKCSEGSNMLQDSWEKFPEVGEAIRAEYATTECFCIVALPSHGIWGVGIAEKGVTRYYAARVSLALAMASQALEDGEDVNLASVPTFEALLTLYTSSKESAAKRARH